MAEFIKYCPRCDRPKISEKSEEDALNMVKRHVELQHPDHDPNWAED